MNPGKERADYLSQRVRQGIATREEIAELLQWLEQNEDEETLKEAWERTPDNTYFFGEESSEKILATILEKEPFPAPRRKRKLLVPALAAVILLLAASTWFFFYPSPGNKTLAGQTSTPAGKPQLMPGGNKAVLVLDDGSTILLDSAGNGNIATQGNTSVSKQNGEVVYNNAENNAASAAPSFNTLRTPKGGQYQLTLSDGTRVWVNAASSLRYPTAFTGADRTVELTGEAYFEVAKDPSKPFHVVLNGIEVEVLGTHFNIMAYENEKAVRATLLEGAVKLKTAAGHALLKPGEQGILTKAAGSLSVTNKVDLNQQVAWKNGYFQFNRTDLETIGRQLERWYDIDIVYEGNVPKKEFWGKIPMNVNADEVLKILENSNVHYAIEGKKIIFKP